MRSDIQHTDVNDVTGAPEQIYELRSHGFVDVDAAGGRFELARVTVPQGCIGIVRRVWQLVSLVDEEVRPQVSQVTDPAFFVGLSDAQRPVFLLAARRNDGSEPPEFPDNVNGLPLDPLRGFEFPPGWRPEGTNWVGNGFFLYPWGCPTPTRIVVSPQTSLSMFVELAADLDDTYRVIGTLLEGEYRQIVNTPNFWHWWAGR